MSIKVIQETFMADFAAMTLTGFGKVYPNLPYSGQKPYVNMAFVHTPPENVGLVDAAGQVLTGFMMFTVVTELGRGLSDSTTAAVAIAARYNFGRILASSGGRIEIPSPPYVMDGFRQDSDWRMPVRVPYRAFF